MIWDIPVTNAAPYTQLIDEYMAMETLNVETFTTDMENVHRFIIKLISGNDTTEAKIKILTNRKYGSMDWNALQEPYERAVIHSREISTTIDILNKLY